MASYHQSSPRSQPQREGMCTSRTHGAGRPAARAALPTRHSCALSRPCGGRRPTLPSQPLLVLCSLFYLALSLSTRVSCQRVTHASTLPDSPSASPMPCPDFGETALRLARELNISLCEHRRDTTVGDSGSSIVDGGSRRRRSLVAASPSNLQTLALRLAGEASGGLTRLGGTVQQLVRAVAADRALAKRHGALAEACQIEVSNAARYISHIRTAFTRKKQVKSTSTAAAAAAGQQQASTDSLLLWSASARSVLQRCRELLSDAVVKERVVGNAAVLSGVQASSASVDGVVGDLFHTVATLGPAQQSAAAAAAAAAAGINNVLPVRRSNLAVDDVASSVIGGGDVPSWAAERLAAVGISLDDHDAEVQAEPEEGDEDEDEDEEDGDEGNETGMERGSNRSGQEGVGKDWQGKEEDNQSGGQVNRRGLLVKKRRAGRWNPNKGGRKWPKGIRQALKGSKGGYRPIRKRANKVVAKDGSGQYSRIQDALNSANEGDVIFVKSGRYQEQLKVRKRGVTIMGEGNTKTIITGSRNQGYGGDNIVTSATIGVDADSFVMANLRVENTAGPRGQQAVALRLDSDQSVLYMVIVSGFQDSFFASTGRHYLRTCMLEGAVDFFFGDAAAVVEYSTIRVVTHLNDAQTIMASGRTDGGSNTGLVICNSVIETTSNNGEVYLGRPWKEYARHAFVNTYLPSTVMTDGWMTWAGNTYGGRPYMGEYGSTGPGARRRRASWVRPGILSSSDASAFAPNRFVGFNGWGAGLPPL